MRHKIGKRKLTADGAGVTQLAEIYNAEEKTHALVGIKAFERDFGAKWPRRSRRSPATSTCCWPSTTSRPSTGSTCAPRTPIESTFATVRLRQRVTKGPGSRAAGVAMAFTLIE